jgi:stalled ribosome alternative rescue factor ArfA
MAKAKLRTTTITTRKKSKVKKSKGSYNRNQKRCPSCGRYL